MFKLQVHIFAKSFAKLSFFLFLSTFCSLLSLVFFLPSVLFFNLLPSFFLLPLEF